MGQRGRGTPRMAPSSWRHRRPGSPLLWVGGKGGPETRSCPFQGLSPVQVAGSMEQQVEGPDQERRHLGPTAFLPTTFETAHVVTLPIAS